MVTQEPTHGKMEVHGLVAKGQVAHRRVDNERERTYGDNTGKWLVEQGIYLHQQSVSDRVQRVSSTVGQGKRGQTRTLSR